VDLVISSAGKPLANESMPIPGTVAEEIARLPEVAWVDPVRIVKAVCEGALTNLIATDTRLHERGVRELHYLQGDPARATAALARGQGAAVNEAFVLRFRKGLGDTIACSTPAGEVRLPIVGVYFDPAFADLGIVLLDRQLYRDRWRDDSTSFIEPGLRPGADRARVMETIRARWGEKHALFILTVEEFRREADELLDQTMLVTYPLVAIAIAIALLGVVNSLLASVLDRIREIGVLRAIGATRGQIARSIVLEATIIGVLGGSLAALAGSILGYLQLDVLFRGMLGITVLYRYPTTAVVFSLFAALILAAAAGYLPGRSAGRLKITDALEYE
ncbi:MAG: ABC transporter permease, partial [Candidatus Binatia bacterium]